ncbi:MAG TPA: hypothetical protein VM618_02045 [Acidimicrobiia bacterium]|nr:hypothetical protein [Acidimicrobiia bacterium]
MDRARDGNLRVGEPDIEPDTPSHTTGTRQGNANGSYRRQQGHLPDDRSNARRSTGIGPKHRNPVVPGAPNISPP